MKTVKLTQKMLKMHPYDLLVKLGAVDLEKKICFPQHVYISKEDYKKLAENLKNYVKKMNPGWRKRLVHYSVGIDMLNYGPNETLKETIRPGYALIDEDKFKSGQEQREESSP